MITSQGPKGTVISVCHISILQNISLNFTGRRKYGSSLGFEKMKEDDSKDFEALILLFYYFLQSVFYFIFSFIEI